MRKGGVRLLATAPGGKAKTGPIKNPAQLIAEDHRREREVCALIDRLAAALSITSVERQMILTFLTEQLPHHIADEEIDLFPLMLERCEPEEAIKDLIEKLQSDHSHALADAPGIAALIDAQRHSDAAFSKPACSQMAEFASQARRHLELENAIILPIARVRLTDCDLKTMKDHMLERRGLDHWNVGKSC